MDVVHSALQTAVIIPTGLDQSCNLEIALSKFEPQLREGAKIVGALYERAVDLTGGDIESISHVFKTPS